MRAIEEQEKILNEAKEFAEKEIRPLAREIEKKQAIPRSLIDKLAERKYLTPCLPEEFGGLSLNPIYYGLFTEEIGKACSATRAILTVHASLVGETICKLGTDEQKSKWLNVLSSGEKIAAFALTEPDVGTDAKSIQTLYKKNGRTFLLNGRKKWITLGNIADVFLVIATDGKDITAFLVERGKGVKTKPINGLLAGKATHIAEIEFDNVEIPETHVLGTVGGGFTYTVNTALDYGRFSIAWAGLSIAQESLNAMVKYSRTRKQFGKGIYSFQLIQGIIGDAVTKVHAARALCMKAAQMRIDNHNDAVIETTMAKYYTSKVAMEVATDAVQVHGGNGCCDQYPVERLFREAKVLEIIEGTSQVQQEIIARFGLRRYY